MGGGECTERNIERNFNWSIQGILINSSIENVSYSLFLVTKINNKHELAVHWHT